MDGNPPKNVIKNKLVNVLLFSYRVSTIAKCYLFADIFENKDRTSETC